MGVNLSVLSGVLSYREVDRRHAQFILRLVLQESLQEAIVENEDAEVEDIVPTGAHVEDTQSGVSPGGVGLFTGLHCEEIDAIASARCSLQRRRRCDPQALKGVFQSRRGKTIRRRQDFDQWIGCDGRDREQKGGGAGYEFPSLHHAAIIPASS